ESLHIDQFMAQGRNAGENLTCSVDTDAARHRDSVADVQVSDGSPSVWREKRVSTRNRDAPTRPCSDAPDGLIAQRCSPEVSRMTTSQVSTRYRDNADLALAHEIAVR